ncbi:hypothetical protein RR47_GL000105 [Enterococcus columbae DSM 7374 = ATCC 51263]|nr:hypothetical protein RR47_GL000105 [Enterococcus columbae DSM 7374 = ATCC 51263]
MIDCFFHTQKMKKILTLFRTLSLITIVREQYFPIFISVSNKTVKKL